MFKELFEPSTETLKNNKNKKKTDTPSRSVQQSPKADETGSKTGGTPLRSGKRGRGRRKKDQPAWDPAQFQVSPVEGKSRFHDLDLPGEIMHAIADLGFQYCTPIQAEILPKVLKGADATGKAQTGTGKSAAFLINIYTHLLGKPVGHSAGPGTPRVLILAPTRELVMQIEKDARDLGKYTGISIRALFGGLAYEKQKRTMTETHTDIVVATPGRLLDFLRQGLVHLERVEILIIDEADRMLDMGFIPDVREIVGRTPSKQERQTMFFSATLTPEVERLSEQWTRNPVHVDIEAEHVAAESVDQLVYIVTAEEKFALLLNLILKKNLTKVLVFTNRRDQADRLAERLERHGVDCAVLSGAVPQNRRIRTLEAFRCGKIRVLVATDVAARGLHVEGISHVINFTLPRNPEDYVHRIGRTGRAGATGTSVSFACEEDSFYIPPIEKFLGDSLHCVYPDGELLEPLPAAIRQISARRHPRTGRPHRRVRTPYAGVSAQQS